MKTKLLLVAVALTMSQATVAQAAEGECATDQIKRSPNPVIEVLTIPFKVVVALTYGPRCLLDNIPKNEQ